MALGDLSVTGITGLLADPQDAGWLQGNAISVAAPADGDALVWNAGTSKWEPGIAGDSIVVLGADQTNNAVALADAAGLEFTPDVSSTYFFEFLVYYTTAALTFGIYLSLNGPAAFNAFAANVIYHNSATQVLGRALNAWDGASTSSASLTGDNFARLEGVLITGAAVSRSLILRFATEVAASNVTIKAGSCVRYRKVA